MLTARAVTNFGSARASYGSTFRFDRIEFADSGMTPEELGMTIEFASGALSPNQRVLGDVNQDGVVDFADIPVFIELLQSQTGSSLPEADCNQDGVLDFADIPAFIEILMNA